MSHFYHMHFYSQIDGNEDNKDPRVELGLERMQQQRVVFLRLLLPPTCCVCVCFPLSKCNSLKGEVEGGHIHP